MQKRWWIWSAARLTSLSQSATHAASATVMWCAGRGDNQSCWYRMTCCHKVYGGTGSALWDTGELLRQSRQKLVKAKMANGDAAALPVQGYSALLHTLVLFYEIFTNTLGGPASLIQPVGCAPLLRVHTFQQMACCDDCLLPTCVVSGFGYSCCRVLETLKAFRGETLECLEPTFHTLGAFQKKFIV